ncbi:ATP-grasp domain-containing protein, partial [Chloroflexota bacterium]
RFRAKLEPYVKIPLHDYSTLIETHDKGNVMKVAKELGIPIPVTFFINGLDELSRCAETIIYPVVIKLRSGTSSLGISYANNRRELLEKYNKTVELFNLTPENYPIVQEYIPGDGYGVSMLFNQGELRARFTHRRLREYPPSGGPGTFRISTEHPEMETLATKILRYYNWHGIAMVEFKLDRRTNRSVLIEINPRFWGSVNQAICSGVNFPYLLYKIAVDGDVEPVLTYKLGVKTRVAFIDYATLMHQLWNKPDKYTTLKQLFHLYPDDIISVSDPLPTLGFLYARVRDSIT